MMKSNSNGEQALTMEVLHQTTLYALGTESREYFNTTYGKPQSYNFSVVWIRNKERKRENGVYDRYGNWGCWQTCISVVSGRILVDEGTAYRVLCEVLEIEVVKWPRACGTFFSWAPKGSGPESYSTQTTSLPDFLSLPLLTHSFFRSLLHFLSTQKVCEITWWK